MKIVVEEEEEEDCGGLLRESERGRPGFLFCLVYKRARNLVYPTMPIMPCHAVPCRAAMLP